MCEFSILKSHKPFVRPLRISIFALLIGLMSACGAGTYAEAGFTARDSAGIRIVENASPAWEAGEGWRLSPKPRVHIGVIDGNANYQFSSIRDMATFPDGRIAVANGGSGEIHIYDSDGGFLRALGGTGGNDYVLGRWEDEFEVQYVRMYGLLK